MKKTIAINAIAAINAAINTTTISAEMATRIVWATEEIGQILADVDTWRAADGGLTEAACDVLRLGRKAMNELEYTRVFIAPNMNAESMLNMYWAAKNWYASLFECQTGAESNICHVMSNVLHFQIVEEKLWECWRKEAGASPGETPRALVTRLCNEGKKDVVFSPEFPCPPDREIQEWDEESAEMVADFEESQYKKILGKDFPAHVVRVHCLGLWDESKDIKFKPEFTGVHYRRAAAMGIRL